MLTILALALRIATAPGVEIEMRIVAAGVSNDIDPRVLRALLVVESRLDPRARSRFGVGIAQFTPAGVRGVNNLRVRAGQTGDFSMARAMNPAHAIPAAAKLLAGFRRSCGGGMAPALAGYNAGYADCRAVRRWGAREAGRRGFRGGRYALKVLRLAGQSSFASSARTSSR